MKKPLNWIPLWIDPWLFGSTRIELSLEQRSVWVDLLTLAGKDSGFIRANEGVPYPPEQLAGMLRVPLDILVATIDRCIETGKLTRTPEGTLYVTTWESYKLTSRYRRMLGPPSHTLPQRKVKESRVEESKGKRNRLPEKGNTVPQKGKSDHQSLPPIPKNTALEIKDDLEKLRLDIRDKESLAENEKALMRAGLTYEEILKDIKKLIDRYCSIVNELNEAKEK